MPNLAVEFREHLLNSDRVDQNFVEAQTIRIWKRNANSAFDWQQYTEFDWACGETRYTDGTYRTWHKHEVKELPAPRARQLVEVYFDGDECG